MAENTNTGNTPAVVAEPTPTHQIASAGFQEQVAELGKLIEKAEKLRQDGLISDREFEERLERQRQKIADEAKKNVVLEPKGTDANVGARGVTWDDIMQMRTRNPEILEAQALNDRCVTAGIVLACKHGVLPPHQNADPKKIPVELWQKVPEYREIAVQRMLNAQSWWDTATSTGGGAWVPTGMSRQAVDFYLLDLNQLSSIFEQVTIPDGVGQFSLPVETSRGQAIIEAEVTNVTTSAVSFMNSAIVDQPTTAVATFIPKKHGFGVGASMEATEDMAIETVMRAQRVVTMGMPRAATQSIINGQENNAAALDATIAVSGLRSANQYSDANGSNGLRRRCIAAGAGFQTAIGGNITALDVLATREAMGDFGAREDELALITSGKGYLGLLQDPNVLTVDKMGTRAVILNGQLASVAGVPVLFTSEFPSLLTAAGIANGTGTTTGAIVVNRMRWFFASKRNVEIIMLPQPGFDVMYVIGRMRTHFVVATLTEHSTHYLINVV